MDIFDCFRWLNNLERFIPCLLKLEVTKGTTRKQHFSFWIIFVLLNILAVYMCWEAITTFIRYTEKTDNVLGVVMFFDNYAPLVLHFTLFRTSKRERNPILLQIHEIDQYLHRTVPSIAIDYKPTQRRSFLQFIALQTLFLSVILIYGSEFTEGDMLSFFPLIYFMIVLSLLLVNFIVYHTIAAIILQKVFLVIENHGKTMTTEHSAKCVILILSCIKSSNELAGKIVFVFITFSSFYSTFGIFVLTRYYQTSFGMSSFVVGVYTIGTAMYVCYILALNLYIVSPAYSLKVELDRMKSLIGMEFESEVSLLSLR